MPETIYFIALIICAILSFVLSVTVFRKNESPGSRPFAIMMAGIAIWTFFQLVVLTNQDFNTKLIISNLRYIGIEIVPLAFYALAREYENRLKPFRKREWIIASIVPVICMFFLWTNPLHNLYYSKTAIKEGFLVLDNGVFFWTNMIYLYVFILLGMYVFIRASIRMTRIYRMQAVLVLISAVFPFIANLLFNFNIINFNNLDLTPFAFVLTGIFLFFALFNMKMLEIVPVARDILVEEMNDLVIVLDNKKRIIDLNKSARKLIYQNNSGNYQYLGKELAVSLIKWKELIEYLKDVEGKEEKVPLNS